MGPAPCNLLPKEDHLGLNDDGKFISKFTNSINLYQFISSYQFSNLSIYLSIHLSIHLSNYLSIYIYLSIYQSIYLSICLSIYPSIYLSICPLIYVSVPLSMRPSMYLLIEISNHLFVSSSNYPSVCA